MNRVLLPLCLVLALRPLALDQCAPGSSALQSPYEIGQSGKVQISEVHLTNVSSASVEEQQQITQALVGICVVDGDTQEIAERIRDGFQRRGFFEAEIGGVQVTRTGKTEAVSARVEEGARYRLRTIKFTGNRHIVNTDLLRRLIPLDNGEVLDIDKIRQGLKNLRDAYGNLGYINFTPVPDTSIDESEKNIAVEFVLDEGDQYSISEVSFGEGDPEKVARLKELWPAELQPGHVYNAHLVQLFFERAKDVLPPGFTAERSMSVKQNRETHTVSISMLP